jgi:hypothetical protein
MSCPQLQGEYRCLVDENSSPIPVHIKQKLKNKKLIFNYQDQDFYPDNVKRNLAPKDPKKIYTVQAYCNKNALHLIFYYKKVDLHHAIYSLSDFSIKMYKKGQNLIQEYDGYNIQFGERVESDETLNCTPIISGSRDH